MQALGNALTQQRLHHAYLFTGTRGVGKTTVSRILAKSLNCQGAGRQGGITATPCGVCQACTDIDSGPLRRLHRARRRLQPRRRRSAVAAGAGGLQAGAGPLQGLHDRRSAHAHRPRLQRHAQDAGRAARVPQVRAGHHRSAEGAGHGAVALPAVQPAAHGAGDRAGTPGARAAGRRRRRPTPQALRLLSRAARGSMRDALSLTDQAIAFGGGKLEEAAVRQMLGSVDRGHVFRLIDALAQGDGKTVVRNLRGVARAGPERRVDPGRNERGAAAHGRDPGRAFRRRRQRPRSRRDRAPGAR